MKERRPLIEGLKPISDVARQEEEAFVFSKKPKEANEPTSSLVAPAPEKLERKAPAPDVGRAPLTVRLRADIVAALKRASLERQLEGVKPFHLQDILEQAVEPWLRNNGYLN